MPLLQENQTNPQTETNSQVPANPTNKGLFTLPDSVMKLVPWIPFLLEATTGQKIPQMSGTIGEIQQGISQIQMNQVQIIQQQQNLNQRLIALETNATNHLTNLTNQFQSLRLTHTREQKQIELQSNGSDFDKSRQFNPNQITHPAENY